MLKTDIKGILRDKIESFAKGICEIAIDDDLGTYADILYEDLIDDGIEEFYKFYQKLLEEK